MYSTIARIMKTVFTEAKSSIAVGYEAFAFELPTWLNISILVRKFVTIRVTLPGMAVSGIQNVLHDNITREPHGM